MELERMEGMFVGSLTDDEMAAFQQAVADGRAYRSYEGVAGLLELAKVRLVYVVKPSPAREENYCGL